MDMKAKGNSWDVERYGDMERRLQNSEGGNTHPWKRDNQCLHIVQLYPLHTNEREKVTHGFIAL